MKYRENDVSNVRLRCGIIKVIVSCHICCDIIHLKDSATPYFNGNIDKRPCRPYSAIEHNGIAQVKGEAVYVELIDVIDDFRLDCGCCLFMSNVTGNYFILNSCSPNLLEV